MREEARRKGISERGMESKTSQMRMGAGRPVGGLHLSGNRLTTPSPISSPGAINRPTEPQFPHLSDGVTKALSVRAVLRI